MMFASKLSNEPKKQKLEFELQLVSSYVRVFTKHQIKSLYAQIQLENKSFVFELPRFDNLIIFESDEKYRMQLFLLNLCNIYVNLDFKKDMV